MSKKTSYLSNYDQYERFKKYIDSLENPNVFVKHFVDKTKLLTRQLKYSILLSEYLILKHDAKKITIDKILLEELLKFPELSVQLHEKQ